MAGRIWVHDLCGEQTSFPEDVNPNKPFKTCQNCLAAVGEWW